MKFLVLFSLLAGMGAQLPWRPASPATPPHFSGVFDEIARPFGPAAGVSSVVITRTDGRLRHLSGSRYHHLRTGVLPLPREVRGHGRLPIEADHGLSETRRTRSPHGAHHLPGWAGSAGTASGYAPAVSRRTPVSFSIRRNDQFNRPSAITCCRLSSLKTLLTARKDIPSLALQCPDLFPLAGFQTSLIGRFWMSPEGLLCS